MKFIKPFSDITDKDSSLVGPKNASLGEMIRHLSEQGVVVPFGFAITVDAYWYFLAHNGLETLIKQAMETLTNPQNISALEQIGISIRKMIVNGEFPEDLQDEITQAYKDLSVYYKQQALSVAVRSSATAEDLPQASFAGQQDTFLNIHGIEDVLYATKRCMASLFTTRAMAYRIEQNFSYQDIGISVGIQKMVRSDKACSGVIFSLDTESGFKEVIVINSSYGLGENIVKGIVNPDEFHIHKPTLEQGFKPIIKKSLGQKQNRLIFADKQEVKNIPVPKAEQSLFSLNDEEILELARITLVIENYYTRLRYSWSAMDIEWAKDGIENKLYVVQARPETVHSHRLKADMLIRYHLDVKEKPIQLLTGQSVGQKIAHGTARVLPTMQEHKSFKPGDILVTSMTDPDWVPLMQLASGIITDQGGRTCHAAIVSRELGIPAIVGTINATQIITQMQQITLDCSQGSVGYIYDGSLPYHIEQTVLSELAKPPVPLMLNIANPNRAYELSFMPVHGVGLARIEFIITNTIKVHPMAIAEPEQITDADLKTNIDQLAKPYGTWKNFFIDTLAQGIATIAAAFYPNPVIVRLSDFKSNEYRNLLAGKIFEPIEENPMLGFRGAVRYCNKEFAGAFALECAAFLKARNSMGLFNIKLMVPFVRTLGEAQCTLQALEKNGIRRAEDGLEIIMMCEIPSNVLLLQEFSQYFDGFSIGSNDLAQLTLGVDRDSALLGTLFDERDPAVKKMLELAIRNAKEVKAPIGICGQAPSDFPEITDLLIKEGIDYISLNADSVIPFLSRITKEKHTQADDINSFQK